MKNSMILFEKNGLRIRTLLLENIFFLYKKWITFLLLFFLKKKGGRIKKSPLKNFMGFFFLKRL